MSKIGKYCKAYPLTSFREFPGWSENLDGFRKEDATTGSENQLDETGGDKFLYLQEDFTVTDGILLSEHVVFDKITADWIEYCKSTLQFQIPD